MYLPLSLGVVCEVGLDSEAWRKCVAPSWGHFSDTYRVGVQQRGFSTCAKQQASGDLCFPSFGRLKGFRRVSCGSGCAFCPKKKRFATVWKGTSQFRFGTVWKGTSQFDSEARHGEAWAQTLHLGNGHVNAINQSTAQKVEGSGQNRKEKCLLACGLLLLGFSLLAPPLRVMHVL